MATAVFFVSWILISAGFIRLTVNPDDKTGGPQAALLLCILFMWIPSALIAGYLNDAYFKALGW